MNLITLDVSCCIVNVIFRMMLVLFQGAEIYVCLPVQDVVDDAENGHLRTRNPH